MYPVVDEKIITLSKCEIDAVKDVNKWKFINNDKKKTKNDRSKYICIFKLRAISNSLIPFQTLHLIFS